MMHSKALRSIIAVALVCLVGALASSVSLAQDEAPASVVSAIAIGDATAERELNLQGEGTEWGERLGRNWRHANDGGWFSYDMPVLPDTEMALQVTYFGSDEGARRFDILVDGTLVGTQVLEGKQPAEFFDVEYLIHTDLTRSKEKVTVRFQALPDHMAGGIYGCRMVRFDRSKTRPANPVFQGADPDVLLVDGVVWVYPTHRNGQERRFFAYSSTDMINWTMHGPIFDFKNVDWIPANKESWAPGMARKDGKFYLYYSVGPKPSHIGVAVSDTPTGPFVDSGKALLSDEGNPAYETIDAMVFTDPKSGRHFLYAGGSSGSKLLVYELNDDMVSLKEQIEVDTPPDFTEGPFMHLRDGKYYMTYSHGVWWDGSYTVRYAISDTPIGPWDYKGVIMSSSDRHRGPGHHSILHNPRTDQWYVIYHRWDSQTRQGPYDDMRRTAIEEFEYDEDGLIKPIPVTDEGVRWEW